MNERRYFAELDDDSTTSSELYATLDGLPATTSESSLTERLATMSATRATTATVGVLVVALWAAGHLGADTMMIAVAVAILLVIWRRPRPRPNNGQGAAAFDPIASVASHPRPWHWRT